MLHLTVVQGLWLILPAYLANMGASIVGGGPPIDGGRNWSDGRRIFGDGKTWRGLLVAPILAAGITVFLHWAAHRLDWGVTDFGPSPWFLWHAWAMGTGALLGDVGASFIKRRLDKPRGERWLGPDQYDFIVGAFLFTLLAALVSAPFIGWDWVAEAFRLGPVLVVLVLTPGLHLLVNIIGYKIGVKDVPW